MKFVYDASGSKQTFEMEDIFIISKPSQTIKLSRPAHRTPPIAGVSSTGYFTVKVETYDESTSSAVRTTLNASNYELLSSPEDDQIVSDLFKYGDTSDVNKITFNPSIVNYITVNIPDASNTVAGRVKLVVNYHSACADRLDILSANEITGNYDGEGPRYSPALMSKVLSRLDALENKGSSVTSLFGNDLSNDDILAEDITGIAPENYVKYELHDINTPAGITIIQPSKGSFYPSNLKVIVYNPQRFTLSDATASSSVGKLFIYSDTEDTINQTMHVTVRHKVILTEALIDLLLAKDQYGAYTKTITGYIVDLADTAVTELQLGIDYTLEGIDIPRTARSTSTEGVYQFIRFLTTRIGEVMISYQAFGGMVAASDIRKIQQEITNTKSVLGQSDILTADKLSYQGSIVELNRRLRRIEEYHNHFEQVEHRISISDPGFHWFNIAAIYDVDWGTALSKINDIGQFRIQSALHKWCYEFIVDVDIDRRDDDKIHIKTLGTNQYSGYDTDNIVDVMFRDNIAVRLCWVDEGLNSGVVLQIGWDFRSYHTTPTSQHDYMIDTDTIIVTNKSGSASLWTLLHDPSKINHRAKGLVDVWQHHQYTPSTDAKYVSGKTYYEFRDTYLYVRTADQYFVEGKQYYTYSSLDGINYEYTEVTPVTNVNAVPGNSTEVFLQQDLNGDEVLNLFERVLYGHYPVQVLVTSSMIGKAITGSLYEITSASYDDTSFTMPNNNFKWRDGDARSNQCVKIIEPEDGIVAWAGNVNLSKFAPGFGECDECTHGDTNPGGPATFTSDQENGYRSPLLFSTTLQDKLSVKGIHGLSLVIFDRLDGRYMTQHASISRGGESSMFCEVPICLEDLCFAKIEISESASADTNRQFYLRELIRQEPTSTGQIRSYYETEDIPESNKLMTLIVKPILGTMSRDIERFDLRQVRLHF